MTGRAALRVLERVVGGLTLTACFVWGSCLLLFGSDAGLPFFPVGIGLVWGGAAVLVLWVLRVVLHLAVTRRAPERRRVRRLAVEPLVLLTCFALVSSGAAFWVRFMLSQSSLNNYAQTASSKFAPGSFTPGVSSGSVLVAPGGGPASRRSAHDHDGMRSRRHLWPGVQSDGHTSGLG